MISILHKHISSNKVQQYMSQLQNTLKSINQSALEFVVNLIGLIVISKCNTTVICHFFWSKYFLKIKLEHFSVLAPIKVLSRLVILTPIYIISPSHRNFHLQTNCNVFNAKCNTVVTRSTTIEHVTVNYTQAKGHSPPQRLQKARC